MSNLRLALRTPGKQPAFAAVAIFTLAMGIGANTAIFTVANALLLKPMPYADPRSLLLITARRGDGGAQPLSWPRVRMIQEQSRSFSGIAAFTREAFNLSGTGDPEQVLSARVFSNFFDVLGVRPAIGRAFLPQEDKAGGDPVVIVSHAFRERHNLAPGQHLSLDGKDYTVIGVLPGDFHFARLGPAPDIYAPRVFEFNLVSPAQVEGGVGFLECVARLRPGVAPAAAQAEMDTVSARYRAANPRLPDAAPTISVRTVDLRDATVANIRPTLLILFGAVALVLLIACANVGSLQLSRALGRRREVAVRMAIGARRGAVVRQLLTESLLLALCGGALGAALSAAGTHLLAVSAPVYLPRASEIRTDGTVLAFTAAASALAGVLFGLMPALQMSRPDLAGVMRAESRGATGGRRRNLLRNLLVVSQVALSMVLITGAGLLLKNFIQLRTASPGFDARDLLTMNIALPPARYRQGPQMIAFYNDLVSSVRALPGVRAATVSSALPVNPIRLSPALPEGQPEVPLMQRPFFNIQTFTPGYAATMGIPLLGGREFTAHDDVSGPPVAMVNETVVRRFWPGANPIGKRILVGRMVKPVEVVGVLGDVRNNKLAADVQPEIYLPFAQLPWAAMNLVVRTAGNPDAFVAAVRSRVLALDRDQPVTGIQTMEELLSTAAAQPRYATTLLGALAGLALLLAVVGIYGAIAYSVAERTGEMGIRMALGAARADILRMVVRQGLMLALVGIGIGLAASLALTRLLSGLLYRVSVRDPLAFAAGAVLFVAVGALASYIPARRATRVDPVAALSRADW
jgi:putative ABC transport system permease protein